MPLHKAVATLSKALDSILGQDYAGDIEVIAADGSNTPALGDFLRARYPQVRVVSNPQRITPAGLNHALKAADGEIILRCDDHAVLPPHYVRRAVATLMKTGADTVGGRQFPVGTTLFERAVAMATTSFWGTGGARYRVGGAAGPTDTVYLGVWRRETLKSVNGFNNAAFINEDYELNWRLRKRGGTVWFDPELVVDYSPRSSLMALARQYFNYGRRKSAMLLGNVSSLRARQLAAPLLVLGLAGSAAALAIGKMTWLAAALLLGYLFALLGIALALGLRHRDSAALLLPLALAAIHLCWGAGFFLPRQEKQDYRDESRRSK